MNESVNTNSEILLENRIKIAESKYNFISNTQQEKGKILRDLRARSWAGEDLKIEIDKVVEEMQDMEAELNTIYKTITRLKNEQKSKQNIKNTEELEKTKDIGIKNEPKKVKELSKEDIEEKKLFERFLLDHQKQFAFEIKRMQSLLEYRANNRYTNIVLQENISTLFSIRQVLETDKL